ncbi:receptor-like protein 49 [Lactuca sativa]|uniref:receptor-like protein 49 n=1 Tax=Lactuca sativa TaxID=4236 RepID=UPI0022AEB406|nr:receptor-like protein 49 [Lactuca sativa]
MGNPRGLGLHLIFTSIVFLANTYTCLGVRNISVVCSQRERLALLKFKHNIKDPSGMLSSWIGSDCCRWEGIQCDGVTGDVERLHLRRDRDSYSYTVDNYLVGNEVSSSLAELRHLKYLDLSGNDFQGSRIPNFIGSLTKLRYLNLSYAGFHGIIPPHIGNLSNLKVLDLSSNRRLMADDMAWTFGLSSLEHLDLSLVNLAGAQNWDMVLFMIPLLKEISLSKCGLSNVGLGSTVNSSRIHHNIKHLDLGFNSFRGSLPSFLQNMTSLTFLDVSGFDLSFSQNFQHLLDMIPSLSELHLSICGLHNMHLSAPHLNFSTLSNIQHLDLSKNSIEGIFPSLFTNMSSLRVLDLSKNMLSSSVPIMPNLLDLDLSFNKFKQIEQVGIWRQCHLKRLKASGNDFDIEMIASPKKHIGMLRIFFGEVGFTWEFKCGLTGPIPESLGRLRFLEELCLSNNDLMGPIPTFLGKLSKLDLSFNQLTGSIPYSFGHLATLTDLHLQFNRLTGPIPTFHWKLSKLDLSFNRLNGSVPESFGKLTALTDLSLEVNQLTGPIPASLGRLVSLKAISLHSNLLNGTIPISFGQLSKLHSLNIFNNSLEGVVSEAHFGKLAMLTELDTSYNTKLTFNVSREWIPPFQLVILQLSSCNIANGFPQWLRNQRKLEALILSNATISGPLPTWLRKLPVISILDLSYNEIKGPLRNLPNEYGSMRKLFLQSNRFNESIPRSLCRMTSLIFLDISRNMLTGKLPTCLENLQNLLAMRFSSNRLSGVIPGSIALNSSSLIRLSLNDNNFSGELPQELGNLRYLSVLDLGDNKFSGSIPEWIGEKLKSLVVLRLHKNNFSGRIPPSLCKDSNLQVLDVACNNLTGAIPPCLGELNAMFNSSRVHSPLWQYGYNENVIEVIKGLELEYGTILGILFSIDLSSNKLVGEIPIELTALSMLVGLNLSNNHLSGGIPDNIGNMSKLESLDFSKNILTGRIPPSMAALTFLSRLNFSYNNLSGQIPTGRQLQTLTDPSIYAGNKDLCGSPLPKNCLNHEDPTTTPDKKYKADDEPTKIWLFYLDIIGGFATGFWGVIGVLLFKKHWRHKLFMFAEETVDKIYVAVMVRVAKMKRQREDA